MNDPMVVAARTWPDATALVSDIGRWTWRELLADANDLAKRLDVRAGGRVAMLARDTGWAVVAIHAARLAGAVLVPLNRRLTLPELRSLVAASDATRLIHDDAHGDIAGKLAAVTPSLRPVPLGPRGRGKGGTRSRAVDGAAIGALVFTSGTTGTPRGVLLTHSNLMSSAVAWNTFLEARPDDHWLAALPLSHVAGIGIVLRAACSGARLSVLDRYEPGMVQKALADDGISHLSLVPAQLTRLLDVGPLPAPRLRGLLLGGAPIPVALVERAMAAGLPVVPTYGLTEAASGVTAALPGDVADHPGSAGMPLAGIGLRVAADDGSDAEPGEPGDILVSGPTVFAGYDHDPGATGMAIRDGWLHTGDIGTLYRDRRLTVVDRRDDLIISGGENISPAEVEAVLATHPGVADAAVVGRPDPTWGAVPVAAVVARAGALPDPAAMESFMRGRLAGFKVPRTVRFVAAIPRTASGKIIRREVAGSIASAAEDSYVDRPGGARIHVRRRGTGPVLVLLHATLSNAQELDQLSAALADGWTVLAIDRRSAGASVMPPADPLGPIDCQVHVEDIIAVLDAVMPGARALVVGHSYGGCIGLELAARHPERVTGAWLFEPPYLSVLPGASADEAAANGRRLASMARDAGLGAAALAFLETVNGPDVLRRLPSDAIARFEREGRGAVADSALLGFRPDGLPGIVVPVVIALGGRSKGPYGEVAEGLAARIATLSVERLPILGHGGPISQPAMVAEAIDSFARRVGHVGPPVPVPGGFP